MTNKLEWKIAKWLNRHGETKRSNVPKWFPNGLSGHHRLFHVQAAKHDAEGYPCISPDDLFTMTDANLDAYILERRRRIHEFRDWLEPAGVVISNIIAIAALIVAILT